MRRCQRADGLPRLCVLAVAARRTASKRKWIERAEDDWGAWGTVYADDDGRVLGSMQYGPSELFPRAERLPAGPPDEDAVLITCAYLVEGSAQWVMQSLFLAAIADVRDRGGRAIEAFGYRYAEGESTEERFLIHRTVFPSDSSRTSGSAPCGASAELKLARLELGGLLPVEETAPAKLLRRVREVLEPEPAPVPRRP